MRTRRVPAGLILFLSFLSPELGPAPAAREKGRLPPPTRQERLQVRGHEDPSRHDRVAREVQSALLAPAAPLDVEHYIIDLKIIPATQRVEGTVGIQARARFGGLSTMDVGLYDVLAVGSIVKTGTAASLAYTRASNMLHVTLDRTYAAGELVELAIAYSGTPPTVGYGSFSFRTHGSPPQPIVSSLSEPTYAPSWWPCVDDPSDKAIVDMNLNVPAGLVGVSNGLLAATIANGDGTTTYQWRSAYPISTYLVSVAVSNYATWSSTYTPVTGGAPMPVQHWVYPEHLTLAQADFSVTVPQLAFFSGLFGEYPFVAEKYGHAIFPFGGGMEHQTVTSYGSGLIRGDGSRYWVIAHEMAHQWWGDSVTLADWRETWLNEGFASYSEALWYEHLYGASGLRSYMTGFDSRPFCGTLYATPCDPFGNTIYDKGAWVLHMLRHVIGDASFFQGLRNWAEDYQYSNATTPDLRATMETASGRFLGGFFDRWVYQTGEPSYRWGWTAAPTPAGWITHVRIEQIQTGAPFVMPIDLRVVTPAGVYTFLVEDDAAAQDFALPPVPAAPTGVALDPDYWVLKSVTTMTLADADLDGVPDTADNCGQLYNPAQADLDADGLGDPCDADLDGDGRANGADCAPADPLAQDPPAEATGLVLSGGPTTSLAWDPEPAQGAGITFEVLRGEVAALVPDGGTAASACFALGLASPATTEGSLPPAGVSFYYLVRGRNVCGGGTLGSDSSGRTRVTLSCP